MFRVVLVLLLTLSAFSQVTPGIYRHCNLDNGDETIISAGETSSTGVYPTTLLFRFGGCLGGDVDYTVDASYDWTFVSQSAGVWNTTYQFSEATAIPNNQEAIDALNLTCPGLSFNIGMSTDILGCLFCPMQWDIFMSIADDEFIVGDGMACTEAERPTEFEESSFVVFDDETQVTPASYRQCNLDSGDETLITVGTPSSYGVFPISMVFNFGGCFGGEIDYTVEASYDWIFQTATDEGWETKYEYSMAIATPFNQEALDALTLTCPVLSFTIGESTDVLGCLLCPEQWDIFMSISENEFVVGDGSACTVAERPTQFEESIFTINTDTQVIPGHYRQCNLDTGDETLVNVNFSTSVGIYPTTLEFKFGGCFGGEVDYIVEASYDWIFQSGRSEGWNTMYQYSMAVATPFNQEAVDALTLTCSGQTFSINVTADVLGCLFCAEQWDIFMSIGEDEFVVGDGLACTEAERPNEFEESIFVIVTSSSPSPSLSISISPSPLPSSMISPSSIVPETQSTIVGADGSFILVFTHGLISGDQNTFISGTSVSGDFMLPGIEVVSVGSITFTSSNDPLDIFTLCLASNNIPVLSEVCLAFNVNGEWVCTSDLMDNGNSLFCGDALNDGVYALVPKRDTVVGEPLVINVPVDNPIPVDYPVPNPVPVPVDNPVPNPIPNPIDVPVPNPIPNPIPVPVPNPIDVPVNIPLPVPNPIPVNIPVPVLVPVPNPVPVDNPVNVPVPVPVVVYVPATDDSPTTFSPTTSFQITSPTDNNSPISGNDDDEDDSSAGNQVYIGSYLLIVVFLLAL